jgi:hypothetical protein
MPEPLLRRLEDFLSDVTDQHPWHIRNSVCDQFVSLVIIPTQQARGINSSQNLDQNARAAKLRSKSCGGVLLLNVLSQYRLIELREQ